MPRAVPGRSATPRAQQISHSEALMGLPRIPCRLCPEPTVRSRLTEGAGMEGQEGSGHFAQASPRSQNKLACHPTSCLGRQGAADRTSQRGQQQTWTRWVLET